MKRERIVRTENIDKQRIKYRVLFGFIFIMCCNGAALSSEDVKMPDWKFSFNLKRVPIIRVFDEIEQKSDFVFAWACDIDTEIHKEISICVSEEPIQRVMEKVLEGSGLVFQRLDRQIVVYRLSEHNACRATVRKDSVRIMTKVGPNDGERDWHRLFIVFRSTLSGVLSRVCGFLSGGVPADLIPAIR